MQSFITALTLAAAVVATPADSNTKFRLNASGNQDLNGWAVVNAHATAGINWIQIQRPAAYQSDQAYLDGTTLSFDLGGVSTPYGVAVPAVPASGLVNVTSVPGEQTQGFALNEGEVLTFNGQANGECQSTPQP
ncbi:hypothetical protein F4861DRAFT_522554 [Xylaria intraflava]|nr:hypothetical protein F4861DRAFT_522554 [Xylaria intraflava]